MPAIVDHLSALSYLTGFTEQRDDGRKRCRDMDVYTRLWLGVPTELCGALTYEKGILV